MATIFMVVMGIRYLVNRRKFSQIRHIASFAIHDVRKVRVYKKEWYIAKSIINRSGGNHSDVLLQEQRLESALSSLEDDFYQIDMLLRNHRFSWTKLVLNLKETWFDIKLHLDGVDESLSLQTLNARFDSQYNAVVDALRDVEHNIHF
ncbi:hypothetical protein SAMN04488136_12265 [Vibrio xiamenensis]|uniref:Uncharacterized protein n=1 Tax=Vibrio xiamenensis TaxID=861298 RepID=A0A1G8E0T0_9VIBR|nr:hypothetical protein [Vibrio xiamenensis]SDH63467.1 hypothetical protein SAMN04488136_12265 [Vibrio xiamenensis]